MRNDVRCQRDFDIFEERRNSFGGSLGVGVKGGGCSGLSYAMDFDDMITDMDEVVDLKVLKVIIDKKSVLYLYGTELDYSDGLNGRGFNWINPSASRTCGCGERFAL